MSFFDHPFNLNHDGKVTMEERFMATSIIAAISDEKSADEDDDFEFPVLHPLKANIDDIESDMEELKDKLHELEDDEPEDTGSARHEHWDRKKHVVSDAIEDMEDKIEERIETLMDKLDELYGEEPDDMSDSAYDRWEERCEELKTQIDELDALS